MPQTEKHLKWCLKDETRLKKSKPDKVLAQKHLKKSEYNFSVMLALEQMEIYDWALNAGFYAIYHCFLALLANFGYQSRNQACTVTALLALIDVKILFFKRDFVLQFDTLEAEKQALVPTVRKSRELSTYGVETSIHLDELTRVKELVIKVQREAIKALSI